MSENTGGSWTLGPGNRRETRKADYVACASLPFTPFSTHAKRKQPPHLLCPHDGDDGRPWSTGLEGTHSDFHPLMGGAGISWPVEFCGLHSEIGFLGFRIA